MNHATTNAWIILAIDFRADSKFISLEKIISAADALNHAIPTCEELQTAIGWLSEQGFVEEQNKSFGLTSLGRNLMADIKSKTEKPFEGWKLLEQRFVHAKTPSKLAEISESEWQRSYENYYSRATRLLK